MPIFFRCSGAYPGGGGAGAKCTKLSWCKVFFCSSLDFGHLRVENCTSADVMTFFLLFEFAF